MSGFSFGVGRCAEKRGAKGKFWASSGGASGAGAAFGGNTDACHDAVARAVAPLPVRVSDNPRCSFTGEPAQRRAVSDRAFFGAVGPSASDRGGARPPRLSTSYRRR